jgi:hypothetical protein
MKVVTRFSRWLRSNAEHYLLIAAQRDVATAHGRAFATPAPNAKDRFFLTLFVPVYRRLPWRFRAFVIHTMPGSHRQAWHPRPREPLGPAV